MRLLVVRFTPIPSQFPKADKESVKVPSREVGITHIVQGTSLFARAFGCCYLQNVTTFQGHPRRIRKWQTTMTTNKEPADISLADGDVIYISRVYIFLPGLCRDMAAIDVATLVEQVVPTGSNRFKVVYRETKSNMCQVVYRQEYNKQFPGCLQTGFNPTGSRYLTDETKSNRLQVVYGRG